MKQQAGNRLRCRLRSLWGVPSGVRPGDLPIHVLEDDGPWVVEGSSTVNPRGWSTGDPTKSSTHST